MADTEWSRRLAAPKGFVEYNPAESFVIHVQWVVSNRSVAREMLDALRRCAAATRRDAPPVLAYFFRISADQSLAEKMRSETKTVGEHPQYAKKYKLLGMGMPPASVAAACQREGLSAEPFLGEGWPSDAALTPDRAALLGFDPVVLDLTEIYLDNRAFSNHAASRDYLDAYSVLMEPHRSLSVHTVVAGTPTSGVWDRILEPTLKARRAVPPEGLSLWPDRWKRRNGSGAGKYVLFDLDFCDVKDASEFASSVTWAPYCALFESSSEGPLWRLELAVPISNVVDLSDACSKLQRGSAAGRAILFREGEDGDRIEPLQKMVGDGINAVDAAGADSFFAGYGLHERVAELRSDSSVECKDFPDI